jgi:hypothetical protein
MVDDLKKHLSFEPTQNMVALGWVAVTLDTSIMAHKETREKKLHNI